MKRCLSILPVLALFTIQAMAGNAQPIAAIVIEEPAPVDEYIYVKPYEMALICVDPETDMSQELLTVTFMKSGEAVLFIDKYMYSNREDIEYRDILGFDGAVTHLELNVAESFMEFKGFFQPSNKSELVIRTFKIVLDMEEEMGFIRTIKLSSSGEVTKERKTFKCSVPADLAAAVFLKHGNGNLN